jgi:hypothetical protein
MFERRATLTTNPMRQRSAAPSVPWSGYGVLNVSNILDPAMHTNGRTE